jgi:hypothetical protein
MTSLSQRWWTERRSFSIVETGLQVEEKTLFSRMSYGVPFEAIPDDAFTVASSSRLWFALALLIPIFAVLWWHSRRAFVCLRCGRHVVSFVDRPEVTPFLEELQLRKMLYLRRTYARELELPDLAQA